MSQEAAVLFENADWTVTDAGLEHRDNGYFIERERLDARRSDGLWNWPLHMLEKTWCTPHAFAEAFGAAVRAYGVGDRNLAASFGAAFQSRLGPALVAIMRQADARYLMRSDCDPAEEKHVAAVRPRPRPGARTPLHEGAALTI